MKKLKVDIDHLTWVFEDAARENETFLNIETGELISEEEYAEADTNGECIEAADNDPQLIPVPGADQGEGFEDMEDFIRTVTDESRRRELVRALSGAKPFRRFKDAINCYPSDRERWFRFKEDRVKARVLEWLRENGIEPIEDTGAG